MFSTVMFQNGQMVSMNGQGPGYHHAQCGVRFSEYVQRTRKTAFPYCQYNGGSMEYTDLWQGRPLKILMHEDATRWRMAKVKSFGEWLPGPFSPQALWDMTIQFTDTEDNENSDSDPSSRFTAGDLVEIHGLKNAIQHNGQAGYISKFNTETGRFAVQYKDDEYKPVCVAVKPSNLSQAETMDFTLVRCNIEGGGTMKEMGTDRGTDQMISFEWLQDATPRVNLNEDGWCIKCPTCREITRDHEKAVQSESLVQETECPVCLDTTQCLPLGNCSHFLCLECFKDCKTKPDGSFIFRIEDIQVNDSPEELARRREELQELTQWSRSTEMDQVRILEYLDNITDSTNDNDRESLIALKKWLLVHPIHIWGTTRVLQVFVGTLGPHAASIVSERVENLRGTQEFKEFVRGVMGEFRRSGISLSGVPGPDAERMNDHVFYHNFLMLQITGLVGENFETVDDFRSAISWYEKNLTYGPQYPADLAPPATAASLANLGLAQKRFGLFNSAEANYRKALEGGAQVHENIGKLHEELVQWRGTSGTVPRMEG